MKKLIHTRRFRLFYERSWRSRPYLYWFNTKYKGGMRRVCWPFFTMDLFPK